MSDKNESHPHMFRREFVTALAARTGLSEYDAARVTDAFLELLTDTWCSQRGVCFPGFGVFDLQRFPGKMARNPRTKEMYPAPPGYKPRFRSNRELRDYITRRIECGDGDDADVRYARFTYNKKEVPPNFQDILGQVKQKKITNAQAARLCGCGTTTFYRMKKEFGAEE